MASGYSLQAISGERVISCQQPRVISQPDVGRYEFEPLFWALWTARSILVCSRRLPARWTYKPFKPSGASETDRRIQRLDMFLHKMKKKAPQEDHILQSSPKKIENPNTLSSLQHAVMEAASHVQRPHPPFHALPVDDGPGLQHAELAREDAALLFQVRNGWHPRDDGVDHAGGGGRARLVAVVGVVGVP